MNLRQLQHLLAVVEHGSVGRAADAINISQPALSKSIQKLEDVFQVKLLDRTPLGVTPTEFGRVLMQHARAVDAELRHATQEIDAMRGAAVGHVAVGAGPVVGVHLLPVAVSRLLENHPGVTVSIIEGIGNSLTTALLSGELDFAIGGQIEIVPSPDVVHDDLYLDRTIVVARREHPLTVMKKVGIEELAQAKWVLPQSPDALRQEFDRIFLNAGLKPPAPVAATNSVPFMRALLMQTDLVSFLPTASLASTVMPGGSSNLIAIRQQACVWKRNVRVSRRKTGSISPLARKLISELKDVAEMTLRHVTGDGSASNHPDRGTSQ